MKNAVHYFVFILLFGISGCQGPAIDTVQANKQIVREAFEVVGSGDYQQMGEYIAQNYTRHCQATPDIEVSSLEDFKEFIRQDRKIFPDQEMEVHKLVAENDLVAFWGTYQGTQTGQFGPFPPTDKRTTLDFSGIHRLQDGKIAETWITWDNLTVLRQLGHFPPEPSGE